MSFVSTYQSLFRRAILRTQLRISALRIFFLLFSLTSISVCRSERPDNEDNADTVPTMLLPELVISRSGVTKYRKDKSGAVNLSSESLLRGMRTFGEADYIISLKYMPGMTNNSGDYSSGISTEGNAGSQTLITIDGMPVIFPYRFGGIFSTFITRHFSNAIFIRSGVPVDEGVRLGSSLNLMPDLYIGQKFSGYVNVGLLSSSATLAYSPANRFSFVLSGRISYIDQIFGKLLNGKSSTLGYSFDDINFTGAYRPTECDSIILSVFGNSDKIHYDDRNYNMISGIRWKNLAVGGSWHHSGKHPLTLNIYHTRLNSGLDISLTDFYLEAPSHIYQSGAGLKLYSRFNDKLSLRYGGDFTFGKTHPQSASLTNIGNAGGISEDGLFESRRSVTIPQNYYQGRLFGSLVTILSKPMTLETGISFGAFRSSTGYMEGIKNYTSLIPDIRISLKYQGNIGMFRLCAGHYTQTLHQIGFSDLGLASDFWIAANPEAPVQRSLNFSLEYNRHLSFYGLRVEAGIYINRPVNQPEFQCQLLEIIDNSYSPFEHLIRSKGINAGGYLSVLKDFGTITGGLGLSYGNGSRHSDYSRDSWRADNAPGYNLSANVEWHINRHWELGGIFRLNSGRCYTPVAALYIIANNLAMEYGKRNSARLPLYHRLDLSATYSFKSDGKYPLEHLVNFSLLNALGHRNIEIQYFVIDPSTGDYFLKRVASLYRFLPSISYTIQF